MKFGGSSVANAERIRHVAGIITEFKNEKPIVVLSAMGDTTDFLLEAANTALNGVVDIDEVEKLHRQTILDLGVDVPEVDALLLELQELLSGISMIKELTKRTRDYLVSFGERMSVRIMAAYLSKTGVPSVAHDAWDVGIISDSNFMSAEPLEKSWVLIPEKMSSYVKAESVSQENPLPIVTGFIAKNKDGIITTLGRGGSDLSATLIGAALGVKEIQTWKDVDGILTADPRLCPDAKPVSEVTYEEASELAFFGAQVLHPRSMVPCVKNGIPVRVKNSYNTKSPGSIIVAKHSGATPPVCAITSLKHVTLIDIVSTRMLGAAGFLAHIFNQFLRWNISIDVIATSEVSVSLTVNTSVDLTGLIDDLRNVAEVYTHTGKSIVTVICDAAHSSALLASGFDALNKEGINVQMISQGASKVNISMIVDDDEADKTVKTLHKAYFEK